MNEVEEIEVSIENCKASIEMDDALGRLWAQPDFKKVIIEGYFKDYAVDMVTAKSNPGCQTEVIQAAIVKSIDGIGTLRQFFSKIEKEAQMSRTAMADSEEELEALRGAGAI